MTLARTIAALGPVGQLAYLPSDFDAAVRYWTETMGVGPFFLLPNVRLGQMRYKGQPTEAVFSIAIAYWGDMQIELVRAENAEPGIYTGEYAVTDRLHHVCIFVDSIAQARAAVEAAGGEILVEGTVGDDGAVIYVDAGGGPGHVIEILQSMSSGAGLFAMIKDASRDWDGRDPLRVLG